MTDPYTPFNEALDTIINETPKRATAVADVLARIDDERRTRAVEIAALDTTRQAASQRFEKA
jgi:hypothetical protein